MKTAPRGHTSIEIDVVRTALAPDYLVLEELGRGGMAIVYRAREQQLDREVAIKVLPSRLAFDADFVDRFQREARTAGQLEHPNIVPIYRVGRSGDVIYFAMKLLRGQSLAVVLRERGKLEVNDVKHILIETAGALGFAAKRGVVHRDIKPDNIVLDQEGRCVVTDFGIAKTASGPLTAAGISMGTPRYMSPEHAQGTPVDGRSDMYSLGVVAYQCLAGTTPFNADDPFAILYKHINEPLPRPELSTKPEKELYAVIERMLAKKPEDRFQEANELLSALGVEVTAPTLAAAVVPLRPRAVTPTQVMITPVSITDRLRRYVPQGRRRWAMAGGVAAVLIGGSYFALRPSDAAPPPPPPARPPVLAPAVVTAARPAAPAPEPPFSYCPRVDSARVARGLPLTLRVDSVRPQKPRSKLQVNYDVCGLQKDASYRMELTVWKPKGGGLRGLFGGETQPVKASYNEKAIGPRMRSRRTMDLATLGPGTYSLTVVVTDRKARRRELVRQVQILEK
jgi:hypothetical protein